MSIIKNFDQLASSPQRKVVLELIESAFESIKPTHVLDKQFSVTSDVLTIQEKTYDLNRFF